MATENTGSDQTPPQDLNSVIEKNIRTLNELHKNVESKRSLHQKFADATAAFVGSAGAFYAHVVIFSVWILINCLAIFKQLHFDPYPFELLSMFASIEAIFLTTIVLINQKRSKLLTERREDLDLQISLFSEHELTRLIRVVDLIAKKLEIEFQDAESLDEQKKDIAPEAVLKRIDELSGKHV